MTDNRNRYQFSFDKDRLQPEVIHGFLSASCWAENMPVEVLKKAIDGFLCIGIYDADGTQVGSGRVVTDLATFAYLSDFFVLPEHGGQGLAREMVSRFLSHPELHQGLRRWMLATADAHEVYGKLGFRPLEFPDMFMEIRNPDVYRK